jgi:hypothetical protein
VDHISNSTTPGCPPVQELFGVNEPRIRDILFAENTPQTRENMTPMIRKTRRTLRFMENNYTFDKDYRRKVRNCEIKSLFERGKPIIV